MKVALAKQMHEIDKSAVEEYGLPELSLMESAGHRVFEATKNLLGGVSKKSICILAGSGNNGGDALTAARYLSNAGARVKIFLLGDKDHRTASLNVQMRILRGMGVELQQLESDRAWERLQVTLRFSDAVIDGVLGTGFSGQLRPAALRLIRLVNSAKKITVAIDIPSGVEADTGSVGEAAMLADCTVALGLPKIGHYVCPGASHVGKLLVDDIGLPAELLNDEIHQTLVDDELALTFLPARPKDSHKGTCGKILIVAGSRGMTGAASLAAMSAMKVGAGLVTLAVPESLNPIYEMKLTEVMTAPLDEVKLGIIGGDKASEKILDLAEKVDAILLGPGLGRERETQALVKKIVAEVDKPLVLDADAIYPFNAHADELKACKQIPILTPHLGELSALLNIPVEKLRPALVPEVRRAAQEYRAIIVAKCEATVVGYPNGEIFISPLGNSSMASGGCGDVLAGAIAGLMKQTPFAPLTGVWLQGTAGNFAAEEKAEGLIASDVMNHLPAAIKKLRAIGYKNS
ncbi:MAG: NAD(P)H-hydrate dehydratase [Selenomonadaceae bacterium]|nr:NAD(P)H-hydrate dehydratase [Selenomonadaceae bacterium]MBQ9497776.1 NAD(P)H-hydrate dehydratase [Selenomonadaceae bacterium]